MRRTVILCGLFLVAGCEDFGTKGTPYGDYQRAREAALQGIAPVPQTIPVTLPVQAPKPGGDLPKVKVVPVVKGSVAKGGPARTTVRVTPGPRPLTARDEPL